MDVSRRRLFSSGAALLAAPAIVKIAAIMPVSTLPASLPLTPTQTLIEALIETQENCAAEVLTSMDVDKFRKILMPGLRAMFEDAYVDAHYTRVFAA